MRSVTGLALFGRIIGKLVTNGVVVGFLRQRVFWQPVDLALDQRALSAGSLLS
jgi:hypothetical protein